MSFVLPAELKLVNPTAHWYRASKHTVIIAETFVSIMIGRRSDIHISAFPASYHRTNKVGKHSVWDKAYLHGSVLAFAFAANEPISGYLTYYGTPGTRNRTA